ncbi:MAG: ABC transporter permease subunit [Pseudonocardiaceae bacterium]|nr:ABC transporter permease subunit [Pseudonocardiaceae bacterium]
MSRVARLAVAVLQIAAVLAAVFTLTAVLPGDTAIVIAGEHATDEQVAALRERLQLDRPAHERFLDWTGGLLHGDFGTSLLTGEPVADQLARGVATTALLTILTLTLVIPLALGIGMASGMRQGSRTDRALSSVAVLLNSVPEFALGLLLIGLLCVQAGWLPATAAGLSGWSLASEPAVLVLPVAVLVSKQLCALARQVRIGVAEATCAEYAIHARLLGLPERTVLARHVLPNAVRPAVQQLARTVDGLLGGVVVVEALFALPGLGSAFVDAVKARDLPAVQGYALVFAATTVAINLLADLAARRLVPQREMVA